MTTLDNNSVNGLPQLNGQPSSQQDPFAGHGQPAQGGSDPNDWSAFQAAFDRFNGGSTQTTEGGEQTRQAAQDGQQAPEQPVFDPRDPYGLERKLESQQGVPVPPPPTQPEGIGTQPAQPRNEKGQFAPKNQPQDQGPQIDPSVAEMARAMGITDAQMSGMVAAMGPEKASAAVAGMVEPMIQQLAMSGMQPQGMPNQTGMPTLPPQAGQQPGAGLTTTSGPFNVDLSLDGIDLGENAQEIQNALREQLNQTLNQYAKHLESTVEQKVTQIQQAVTTMMQAQQAQQAMQIQREIDSFFDSKAEGPLQDFYGKGKVGQAQKANRSRVEELAGLLISGANNTGRPMNLQTALEVAHSYITRQQMQNLTINQIMQTAQKRQQSMTIPPGGVGSNASGDPMAAFKAAFDQWHTRAGMV